VKTTEFQGRFAAQYLGKFGEGQTGELLYLIAGKGAFRSSMVIGAEWQYVIL